VATSFARVTPCRHRTARRDDSPCSARPLLRDAQPNHAGGRGTDVLPPRSRLMMRLPAVRLDAVFGRLFEEVCSAHPACWQGCTPARRPLTPYTTSANLTAVGDANTRIISRIWQKRQVLLSPLGDAERLVCLDNLDPCPTPPRPPLRHARHACSGCTQAAP
jgi:hypothetical protein